MRTKAAASTARTALRDSGERITVATSKPPNAISFVQSYHRKRVETAGSLIEQLLPKSIHAVTSQGFELKVALFVIASSLNCYLDL